jgi:hypothetical protein
MRVQDDARRSASGPRATVLKKHPYLLSSPSYFLSEETEDEAAMSEQAEPILPARQDKTILHILRAMAMGHLFLGLALALSSVILEAYLH